MMSKNNELRKARRLEVRRKVARRTALNVFLKMQGLSLRERLKLARLLVWQSDLKFEARKQGKSVSVLIGEMNKPNSRGSGADRVGSAGC